MNKPADWDQVHGTLSTARLTAGGHICKIVGAKVEKTSKGNICLVLALDIEEGTGLDGYFQRRFNGRVSRNGDDAKWPCVYYQTAQDRDGKTTPYFKGLIEQIEVDNPGYLWDWNEKSLNGKYIGFLFGKVERLGSNGPFMAINPIRPIPCEGAQETPAPDPVYINGSGPSAPMPTEPPADYGDEETPF